MRHEYEIDEVMFAVFELSRYADVPAARILDAIKPIINLSFTLNIPIFVNII